ncbi:MAG: NAD(+)/NADH kinase [Desulfovibrio sp.]|jgi:NAD+ kinase|nr:NAD(+)/NADH kinase [Desulfovibrio sp.]
MSGGRALGAVALVVKKGNRCAGATCAEIADMLARRGVPFSTAFYPDDDPVSCLPPDVGLILVLGGDGTFIAVARRCLDRGVPVGGVNFGRVGFLNELTPENCVDVLAGIPAGGPATEKHMTLQYTLLRGSGEQLRGEAVNDVVLTRGRVARLCSLRLAVNGRPFIVLRSDGLIFSTPIGSSGYSGSAGGPLMAPGLNAYAVTAICPYLNGFRPMALSPETRFSVLVEEPSPDIYLTVDGQESRQVAGGDVLEVYGMRERLITADFGAAGYFERLLQRGFAAPGEVEKADADYY